MRNKSFLPLIEQVCMIAVFAIVAVLCVQGFSLAYRISYHQEKKDEAVLAVQNAAETLKSTFGNLEQAVEWNGGYQENDIWYVPYDEQWKPVAKEEAEFLLVAKRLECENDFLGGAIINAMWGGEILFTLEVHWQEG